MEKKEKKKPVRKLTMKEKNLVKGVLQGKTQTQAAIEAGYSERSARQVASRVLTKDDIQALIESHAEKALSVIHELTTDPETPHAVRLNGAKDILDRAGHKPKEKIETTGKDGGAIEIKADVTVNYEAMTPKEIQEAIKKEMGDI